MVNPLAPPLNQNVEISSQQIAYRFPVKISAATSRNEVLEMKRKSSRKKTTKTPIKAPDALVPLCLSFRIGLLHYLSIANPQSLDLHPHEKTDLSHLMNSQSHEPVTQTLERRLSG
jgi:hypothetical protein